MAVEHRTALVTGAGSGIGRAIAQALAGLGVRVALVGRRREALEETMALLGDSAGALVAPADVADREGVADTVATVLAELGSIDILICNAGINIPRRAMAVLDPADWDRLIATNLTGAFNLVHAVLPSMRREGRGLVIQVASIAGLRAGPLGGVAYSASKFGQSALGICLGREERQNGIKSSVIYPGEVNTPILEGRPVPVPPERRAAILQPEDIAAAVRFLAELPARTTVPELIITPAVDEFF